MCLRWHGNTVFLVDRVPEAFVLSKEVLFALFIFRTTETFSTFNGYIFPC
jgi:hypothetical protein